MFNKGDPKIKVAKALFACFLTLVAILLILEHRAHLIPHMPIFLFVGLFACCMIMMWIMMKDNDKDEK